MNILYTKIHQDANIRCAYNGTSAAFDIACVENVTIEPHSSKVIPTGLRMFVTDPNYYLEIHTRSSLGFKHDLRAHLGVIDYGYNGDFSVKIFNHGDKPYTFNKGDFCAQVLVKQKPDYNLVELNLEDFENQSKSERGSNGFGSSGK